MTELKGACLIGQSGGPTAVINASAYGVIKTAMEQECITHVYAAQHGIRGVLEDDIIDMEKEDPEMLELMMSTPASLIRSCRYKLKPYTEDESDYKRILEIFKKYNIRYFFYNGGNDSMDTCNKISEYMSLQDYECRIIGIPKTIDNDLLDTDHCPGYGSAAKYIATSVSEVIKDVHVYDKEAIVINKEEESIWVKKTAHIKGTHRNFVEPNAIDVWKGEDGNTCIAIEFKGAWSIESEPYVKLAKEYNVDIKIEAFERGMEFSQYILIENGELKEDKEIEYDDYVWDCVMPNLGG